METLVRLPWDIYEELLDSRRDFWDDGSHREIPECIWDWVIEGLKGNGGLPDPWLNDPRYIVDNLIVNGSWEGFEGLRRYYDAYSGMTDDEIADSIEEEGCACAVFREERLVLWNTGL